MKVLVFGFAAVLLAACGNGGSAVPRAASGSAVQVGFADAVRQAETVVQPGTLQQYSASAVGDSIQITIVRPFKDAPLAFSCPADPSRLYPFEKPQMPDQSYVYASPYFVGQYEPLFLSVRPCNANVGDLLRVTILPGSESALINVSVNGFVTFLPSGGVAKLRVRDVTTGAAEDVVVRGSTARPLSIAPASLVLATSGPSSRADIVISEDGYTSAYIKTNTCGRMVSFGGVVRVGSVATVRATAVASGSCVYLVRDVFGQRASVPIVVSGVAR
jgi:hypothetical protein